MNNNRPHAPALPPLLKQRMGEKAGQFVSIDELKEYNKRLRRPGNMKPSLHIPLCDDIGAPGAVDAYLYVKGDTPDGTDISANHSHIYIDGKLSAGSNIHLRQGIVCASSLAEGASVEGGYILIVEDENLSLKSKNFFKFYHSPDYIFVVPKGKKEEVFSRLIAFHNMDIVRAETEKEFAAAGKPVTHRPWPEYPENMETMSEAEIDGFFEKQDEVAALPATPFEERFGELCDCFVGHDNQHIPRAINILIKDGLVNKVIRQGVETYSLRSATPSPL